MSEGFAVVKEALESVYTCMGITCAQVGGLLEEGTTDYISGFEPCTDGAAASDSAGATTADSASETFAAMAGYTPGGFDVLALNGVLSQQVFFLFIMACV